MVMVEMPFKRERNEARYRALLFARRVFPLG
jgi:hypothetical protein